MTSFPSDQEHAFYDTRGVHRIEHETITHYETTIPSETDINKQPQKTFSFNDKIETSESLRQKAQNINSNEYLSSNNGNYYSAAVQSADADSKDLNSRLDKLLKSAESVLTRAKTRGGSVSHHQVSSPIIEIDSALTFNTAEGNKRNIFTMQTPSIIPQEYSPSSQPSQPSHPLNQSLSLSSAGLPNQNPMNLTPNALSHRYEPSPVSHYASQTVDPQYTNTLTVSYNLSSDTQKRSAGLSSIPVSSSIKYTPADQGNGQGQGGNYTSRSYTVGTEYEQRPAAPSYENQMQNMNTLPRSYNLFPIRETERSSHVSNNNLDHHGGNDVSMLKKGINNVEEMLRSLDNNHVGVGGIVGSQDLLTKTLNAQFDQNRVDYSTTEPYERNNNSYISTIYPLKTKEYEVVEQPKKSYATNSEYSQSYNNIPNYNYSSTYSHEGLKSSALRQSELEGQEKTHQAMKNIDQLMHRHIFHNRPLTKSTVDLNQPLRYMSPTRGSGQSNEFYGNESRQWATLQPQTQTLFSEQSQYPREREVRAVAHSYQASLHATPKISVSEAPKSIQQFREPYHSDIPVASQQSIKENTYTSPVKDLTLPRSYGSTTNYKEYLSSPRPARSHFISSPLHPDERELSYAENRTSERFKGTGLTFGQGIDYDRYYNPEILNSADRKMKRLTLRAKSPEERDSEKRDQFRYTPSDIREVYGAEYLFSEPDASHFDFRPSANDLFTDPDSHRRASPKAVPNQFKAGELMADRESSSRGAIPNVTKAGELQDDHHVQHQHTYQTQSSVSHFKAGDLQHDHEGFRAGDLQPDRDQAFKAGELQPDHDAFRAGELQNDQDKQNFNSGELEDERAAQKALQSRNVADDGRAWQMVHKIDSRILESVEHSFDFEHAGGLTPQNQQIPHESLKRGHAPTSEEKRLQRVVDPNLWIVNPPKVETYNASKGSQMLKQSVKKAHKKPIITHCFEKFEDREFATSNSKR